MGTLARVLSYSSLSLFERELIENVMVHLRLFESCVLLSNTSSVIKN